MNTILRIQQIWQYLEVQDNEILIIRFYNHFHRKDEYLLVKSTNNGLTILLSETISDVICANPFRMIQQRNKAGQFIIPSVNQLIKDMVDDY